MKIHLMLAAGLLSLGSVGVTMAAGDHAAHAAAAAEAKAVGAPSTAMTAAEVRKVDPGQGKVTLKHEAIPNLDMPPMTMVFRVERAELIKDLRPGDKVRFRAEGASGAFVVTDIQKGG